MNKLFIFLILWSLLSCKGDKAPSADASGTSLVHDDATPALSPPPLKLKEADGMVRIPAGILHMGGDNNQADANEFPKHEVQLEAFWMDKTEVTNAMFQEFVDATNYMTVAERAIDWDEISKNLPPDTPKPADAVLAPGALVFTQTTTPVPYSNPALWWSWTLGANWKHPEGPDSDIKDKAQHPVVQIAWEDAVAYAAWADKRLPTEAEWEWAARGGLDNAIYPWGNEDINVSSPKANFWQGLFPYENTLKDGHLLSAPVGQYRPNGYGLYDMAGNVWEWCSDWYQIDYYKSPSAAVANNKGPNSGLNRSNPYEPHKVMRGGSFLCNDDYCSGYRNARRMGSSTDTGLNHTGFRCVRTAKTE